jgi:hypothetical protein
MLSYSGQRVRPSIERRSRTHERGRDRGAGGDREDGGARRGTVVAANNGMRALRSRGTELERDFAFGVVRQLFEPVVADSSESQRDLLLRYPRSQRDDRCALA